MYKFKTYVIMQIKVYLSMDLYRQHKSVYVGRVNLCSGIDLDYNSILYSMRCIYGQSAVVEFLVVS